MQAPHVATGSLRLHEGAARRPTLARRAALALATATLASLALAAPAQADTTIGQTGGEPGGCQGPFVYADTTYVVPAGGGQITDFSFESNSASPGGGFPGNDGQQLDFLVLRPAGGSNYTVVGKTGLVTLRGTGLETFPVNIRVQGGDILGLWIPGLLAYCVRDAASDNAITSLFGPPDPNVGDTVSLPVPAPGNDLNESANLVPPRCQGQDATIVGTGRGDKLRGTKGDDVIAAKGGGDTVTGLRGDDLVCGGSGNDKLRGQGGDDTLNGGDGNDVHRGGGGTDVCRGGGGSDRKRQC
jgi:Ca2+-binding RTX toxin-like protein